MNEIRITIRHMCAEDAQTMAEIERECFSQPWSAKAFAESGQDKNYEFLVATEEERVVGYIGCTVCGVEADITNVAVAKTHRRLGIGKNLLEGLFRTLAKRRVEDVFLEVRQSNLPAIALYEQAGFQKVGVRKNFYSFPTEDAILMKTTRR